MSRRPSLPPGLPLASAFSGKAGPAGCVRIIRFRSDLTEEQKMFTWSILTAAGFKLENLAWLDHRTLRVEEVRPSATIIQFPNPTE